MPRLTVWLWTSITLFALGGGVQAQSVIASSYGPIYPGPVTNCPPPAPSYRPLPSYTTPSTPAMPGSTPSTPGTPGTPSTPGTAPGTTPATPPSISPQEAVAGGGSEAGSGASGSLAPNMIGDLGVTGNFFVAQGTSRNRTFVAVPIAVRGTFKISENESPRPQDRIFFNFNYFNDVHLLGGPPTSFQLYRETFGFEKTFLDQNASFGVRLPVFIKSGDTAGVGIDGVGDVSVIGKYAFINNRDNGNLLSGGLVVTAPTGRDALLADGTKLNSTFLEPYVGYIYNLENSYLLGFSSIIVPTDSRDTTFIANDLAFGYRLYRGEAGSMISQIVPVIEGHINTPLNNRTNNVNNLIYFPDQVVLTGGVHFGLYNRTWLTLGAATPVSGPKPFDFEILALLNYRF
jgi:hypothetical protein